MRALRPGASVHAPLVDCNRRWIDASGPEPKTDPQIAELSATTFCALPRLCIPRFAVYTRLVHQASQLRCADILQNLQGFDDWLRRLGVPARQADRAHRAIRVLEKAERAFLNGTNQADGISQSDYLFGLTEALELHDVYLAFRDYPPQQLCERLTRALSGPALPESETPTSRDGRIVMFELALGAEWALCELKWNSSNRIYFSRCLTGAI